MIKKYFSDFSLSSITIGFLVCLVGYSSSALIIFEVGKKFGLNVVDASSWLGVLCIAMGILTIGFSSKYKVPILFAWSTPGAVLLLNSSHEININNAIGAFVFSSALILIFGFTGLFEKIMNKIPASLAHAMLAGVLFKFALGVFSSFSTMFSLSLVMFLTFLITKRFWPKFSIILVMLFGIIFSYLFNLLHLESMSFNFIKPLYINPTFDFKTIIGIGLPLFIVTMTSQNLTGLAVLKSFDYKVPISKVITYSGMVNLIISPFGGFALNLAAITAAISMGPDTHMPREKRYTGAVVSGFMYLVIGFFSTTFGSIFSMFPKEMIAVLTGIALFNTISNSIVQIGHHPHEKDSAMLTFFVTASGVTLFGIGPAFWGILVGSISYLLVDNKLKIS